ncbi:MAG: J domain-containing protein [Bacteroidota bacterium]|jgi:curved DNA-binding protein CbpA
MAHFYRVLGLNKTASQSEIKAAFRRLAKIYHPDKNPNVQNAKFIFEDILLAYNVLSDSQKRKIYDNSTALNTKEKEDFGHSKRGNRNQNFNNPSAEDLQQREFYKNYYNFKQKSAKHAEPVKVYSDYKYILFATPLAIGLFLLIISMFSPAPETITEKSFITKSSEKILVNGDKPYIDFFGKGVSTETTNFINFLNDTPYDAIVAIFKKKDHEYFNQFFLQSQSDMKLKNIPPEDLYLKCVLGTNWNFDTVIFNNRVVGSFKNINQYQNLQTQPILFKKNNLIKIEKLNITGNSTDCCISNELDFFTK